MDNELQFFPEQASTVAPDVDAVYWFLIVVSTVMTLLIAGLIIFFAIKYRHNSKADRTQSGTHFFWMELSWLVIPFILTMIMFFWGAKVYFVIARAPAGAMQINAVGRQWMWKFQHPDGRSEINDLHVPLGQPVKLNMISEDVIHSMYVPAFRVKQDVLPGRYTTLWFEATRLGEYHLFCAEYCGAKHSEMKGKVVVMEPSEYEAWLSGATAGETPVEAGRKLFEQLRCETCHKGGGEASRGPALADLFGKTVRLQNGQSVVADENYLRESILRPAAKVVAGYQPIMPTFEGQVGEEGVLQLIAYLKSLSQSQGQERTSTQP
jgi:cytochrome c oxidase subunit 2